MRAAALYVQTDGCYTGLPDVDAWPEHRDARLYAGPLPVVAHPPCQLWGAMAAVNYSRWGGEHNRPGNDGGCFAAALAAGAGGAAGQAHGRRGAGRDSAASWGAVAGGRAGGRKK